MPRPSNRPPALPGSFAFNLRRAREARELTQEQLAALLKFKRTTPLSLWERNPDHIPQPDTIKRLAKALRMSPAELMHDVITPYDVLRGETRVASRRDVQRMTGGGAAALSADELRWVRNYRLLDGDVAKKFTALIEEHLRLVGKRSVPPDGRVRAAGPHTAAVPSAATAPPVAPTRTPSKKKRP